MALDTITLEEKLKLQVAIAREERAKRNAVFSSLGEGVIVTEETGRIISVNQTALDILGYIKSELNGQWFPGKIIAMREDGSTIGKVDRPITRAFITGKTINERMFYKRKNGTTVPVSITVSPILYKGKPTGAIEIFRDITDELQSDHMKMDFISIASHQLRTPLSAINTYSHMISEGYAGKLNATQESFMAIILSATERMNELISTLLNITRIEAGSIEVESKPADLGKLLRSIVTELTPQIKNKQIALELVIEKEVPDINTDALLVTEIFTNLITNALKYTPAEGEVTISLYKRGNEVICSVKDNGFGIPASVQDRVFTKFFRASNVIKREVSGTGLGLYLIKILAENLNGEVWFKSQENKGTTFYFSLPLPGSLKKKGRFRFE